MSGCSAGLHAGLTQSSGNRDMQIWKDSAMDWKDSIGGCKDICDVGLIDRHIGWSKLPAEKGGIAIFEEKPEVNHLPNVLVVEILSAMIQVHLHEGMMKILYQLYSTVAFSF